MADEHKREREMPLTMLSPGKRGRVTAVQGGYGLNHRLAEMGLSVGTEVVLMRSGGGPVVVNVRGMRLMLGHGMAHRIMVDPIDRFFLELMLDGSNTQKGEVHI